MRSALQLVDLLGPASVDVLAYTGLTAFDNKSLHHLANDCSLLSSAKAALRSCHFTRRHEKIRSQADNFTFLYNNQKKPPEYS